MTRTEFTPAEIQELFDQVALTTPTQRSEKMFTALSMYQVPDITGVIQTHTTQSEAQKK